MSMKTHIHWIVEQCHWLNNAYVQDLTDAELMLRPVPGMNHMAWQLGHLISSSSEMLGMIGQPGVALPAGFAEAHSKEAASCDDPKKFATKAVYLDLTEKVKAATVAAIEAVPDNKLEEASPEGMREYAPTTAAVLTLLGTHWLMHSGQFVAVRRKLGKPAMF
jgi:hypothetical protein